MATVLNNVFPWGMYFGGDTAPNGAWGIIDETDRKQVHVTTNVAVPNVVHTFPTPAWRLVHDGVRWVALIDTATGRQCYRAADGTAGAGFAAVGAGLDAAVDFLGAGSGALFSHDLRDGVVSRSTDGGLTWSVVISASRLTTDGFSVASFRPARFSGGDGPTWIYAPSQSNDFPPLIYVSTDNGATWGLVDGPKLDEGQIDYGYLLSDLAVLNGVIYLNGYRYFTADYRVYKSVDLGATWSDVSSAIPTPSNGFDIVVAKQGFVYLFSRYGASGEHVEVRRIGSAGVQVVLEPLLNVGFPYLLMQSVLISTEGVAFGNGGSIEDTTTVVFDLPSLGEAVEFLSTVSTAVGLTEFELTHLQFLSSTIVASATSTEGAVSAQIVSSTTVAALVLGAQFELASLGSVVSASPTLTGAGTFAIALESGALITFATTDDEGATDVWVLNLDVGGLTRYEGFNFNSFAKIGANYYGCKGDGIYQLDGDTDAGAPIRSMVSFGKQDFGASALKRITNAYVGVSGQGRLFLRVMAEGQEYTYAARSHDEHLQVQRFDTGKGLRVNWLEFELYNADGEDFELASIEFAVVPTSRRI